MIDSFKIWTLVLTMVLKILIDVFTTLMVMEIENNPKEITILIKEIITNFNKERIIETLILIKDKESFEECDCFWYVKFNLKSNKIFENT